MRNINEIISIQLQDLMNEGESILGTARNSGSSFSGSEVARVSSWVSKCGQMIKSLSEKDSVYLERYIAAVEYPNFYNIHSNHYKHIGVVLGCIKALCDDYQKGLLTNIRYLLRAEIFGDFLEMAEYLLNEGYKDAAAVITGTVLEDSLRKLAIKHGIQIEKENGSIKTIEPLNQELGKLEVYTKLVQKQITSWADLRNQAAHGNFDRFDKDQVHMMLLFVEKFCSDYPA